MDLVLDQLKKPVVAGVVGLVVGVIFGLIWGYVIAPVEWRDINLEWAREDIQKDYLWMAIDSYQRDSGEEKDEKAKSRFNELGDAGPDVLAKIQVEADPEKEQAIQDFIAAVEAKPTVIDSEEQQEEGGGGGARTTVLLVACVVTIILIGAIAAFFLFRQGGPDVLSPAAEAQKVTSQIEQTDFAAREGNPPMSQFMTTYMLGDDLFDDSFSIDSQAGEFLGECGVGISESIGVGEPKKVTAFEVWLFDKNDIQTITKVLMSQHAFTDDSLRGRLAAKGDPFLVEPGGETVLETATLRLICRVVDMAYGIGPSPDESHFERVTLELAVWQKG